MRVLITEPGTGATVAGRVVSVAHETASKASISGGLYVAMRVRTRRPLPLSLVGQDVSMTIAAARTPGPVLAVPEAAIFAGANGQTYVSKLVHGQPVRVAVRVGMTGTGLVQVTPAKPGALAPGEMVVTGQNYVGQRAGRPPRVRRDRARRQPEHQDHRAGRGRRMTTAEMTAVDEADEPVIELAAAGYTYPGPPPVRALKPADLVIERGEHVAIMGPSGSGKSTLLNLLGLLDRPTEGRLRIDGIDLGRAPERDRAAVRARRIGFVFQSFHLLPHRSAVENVMLAQVYADMPRRRRYRAAMTALAEVGLDSRAQALPTALSGGERQRVAIARALVNRPSLLLCDEPTGNLDTAATTELTDLLGALHAQGATLVVITHNPAVAALAQRQISIRDGWLSERSPVAQPVTEPENTSDNRGPRADSPG